MARVLVIILRISHNQFECNYLKTQKIFLGILLRFLNLHKISNILKKKKHDPNSLIIPEIIDSKRRGYLNS